MKSKIFSGHTTKIIFFAIKGSDHVKVNYILNAWLDNIVMQCIRNWHIFLKIAIWIMNSKRIRGGMAIVPSKKNCKSNLTYILLFGPLMLLLRLLTKLVSYFEHFFPNDFRGFDDKSLVMDQKKSQVLSFIQ